MRKRAESDARAARKVVRARIAREGKDIELIISYLNGHLDAEQAELVRRRLDEDAAFRDLTAPLRFVWSIPSYLERHPRPEGELEAAWADFVRRAGIEWPPEGDPV